jgi:hypothetical protein
MLLKSKGAITWVLTTCMVIYLAAGLMGCATSIANKRAEKLSGKIREEKGALLMKKEQIVEEYPPTHLSIYMNKIDDALISVSIKVKLEQRMRIESVYEKIGVYEVYRTALTDYTTTKRGELVANVALLGIPIIPNYGIAIFAKPSLDSVEEKVEGEIIETEEVVQEVESPLAYIPVTLDCGPAGQYTLKTDENGIAEIKLKPLLNRLTKNYKWTIKASAKYEDLTDTDSLVLNTSNLGVTWKKPRFQPDLPPRLFATASFKDKNNNQTLDAKEKATLFITLKNTGRGDAFQINVKPEMTGKIKGVTMSPNKTKQILSLAKGQEKTVEFSLSAKEEVPAQRFRIRISFNELNGFEPEPISVNLSTRPYSPPKLTLTRWALDDDNEGMSSGNGNRRLERGEQAELTFYVQNLGAGSAENVKVGFNINDSNLFSKALNSDLGEIPPGEWRKAVFTLRVNNRYKGTKNLPIDIAISERRSKYSFDQPLEIVLGKDVSKEQEIILAGNVRPDNLPDPVPLPKLKQKQVIKITDRPYGNRYAVLIGINNYIDSEVRALAYAEEDIRAIYDILATVGKYEKNNIFYMTPNAEQPQDRPTRTNILLTLKWLSENLKPEDSVLLAFCGHGDTDRDVNYIIPLDGRLALPQDSSIQLGRLFEWLDACPAQRQVVMLDACHSGGSSTLIRGDRGIEIISKSFTEELERIGVPEGRAVLASCSIEEVSYEEPRFGHGVFTYFMLNGLDNMKADRNRDGQLTVYELGNYVQKEVKSWSKKNRKSPSQTPRMVYSDTSGEIVMVKK